MSTPTPRHIALARKHGQTAVLYAALALSAPGEFYLALSVGWEPYVAWLMPAVLSLYAAIGASVAKGQKEVARSASETAPGSRLEAEAQRRSRSASVGALIALALATAAQVTWHVMTAETVGLKLWVVVAVSAVPPLVAAHVLHIDPPMELPDDEPPAQVWPLEELEEIARGEQIESATDRVPEKPESVPVSVLVTYKEAAAELGVEEVTVRGWAVRERIKRYPGSTPTTRRVSLEECRRYQASQMVKA
ncbi:hypothetical protein ACIGW0_31280 [Streptomyces bikiniensis]|uniref:Uncharacterized protein n=1 Tax=Streptomyces bikiniensis TaxID=1896 RepID=A0ABW8D1T4_STRBI